MTLTAQAVLNIQACGGRGCPCAKSQTRGNGLTHCLVPCHVDAGPSMSVKAADIDPGGAPVMYCHAGCSSADLFAAYRELDESGERPRPNPPVPRYKSHGTADHRHQYLDAEGQPVAVKSRWNATADRSKNFVWEPVGTVAASLLYGRELADQYPDATVVIFEGEQCVDAARAAGIVCAMSGAGGAAGTPSRKALAALAGRRVLLFPDNDAVGIKHMQLFAANLPADCDVRWVDWADAPAKGDVVDFLEAHPGDAMALTRLLHDAKRYAAPAVAAPAAAGALTVPELDSLRPRPADLLAPAVAADQYNFGLASDYAKYAAARLNTPVSEQLLLGCAIVAAAVGPGLVSELSWTERRPNIWILLIGASGASKSTRMALASELIHLALPDRDLPTSSTPESLMELLRDLTPEQARQRLDAGGQAYRGAGITFKDEYSTLLRQITNPGYMAGAGENLIKLYDGDPLRASTKAGGTVTVSRPCLTLVASITPYMFAASVKPSLIGGGFLARHIHQLVPKRELTPSAMAGITTSKDKAALVNALAKLRHNARNPSSAQWTQGQLKRWDEYRRFLERELAAEEQADELDSYYQRFPEHGMKLAMLLSYSEAVKDGTATEGSYPITDAALLAAIQVVEGSRVAVRETIASLSDSLPVREAHRVVRWLTARGGRASSRQVYKGMHWSAKDAREYRQTAEAHGLIEAGGQDWILAE